MGKYLDLIRDDINDINDGSPIGSCTDGSVDNAQDTFGRIDRLCRSSQAETAGNPHPVYGHDEFSLIRLPAILRSRRRP
jgi:hypothetical protein